MRPGLILIFLSALSSALATDLVAVYKHDVLLLRDVDTMSLPDGVPMNWESLVLNISQPLSHPIGLTYDPEDHRLFVAEAVHQDTRIFSLFLTPNYTVERIQPVLKTRKTTIMEALSYDPRTRQLYWTDSYNHGVYKTFIPSEKKENPLPQPESAYMFDNVIEPRGIAIDYCNEQVFWSERDGSGTIPSSIEMCDLQGSLHTIVQQGDEEEVKIFYQGLTYDIMSGKLLWAETIGDKAAKSYCRIISYEFGQGAPQQEVLVSLENCYPFSLITDENYIYWADWGRKGIMRASRKDPNNVVKLVHTPDTDSEYGEHHGVYGLAILNGLTDDSIKEVCKGKSNPARKVNKDQEDRPVSPKFLKSSSHVIDEVVTDVEPKEKQSPMEKEEFVQEATQSSHIDDKEKSIQGNQEIKLSQSYSNIETNPGDQSSESGYTQKQLMKTHVCSENQLLIVIIVLAVFCVIFMSSTLILIFKHWCRRKSRNYKSQVATSIANKGT